MRMQPLDELFIELSCDYCRYSINGTLRWLTLNDDFHCPRCSGITTLNKDDLFCGYRRIEDALMSIRARISRFSFVE